MNHESRNKTRYQIPLAHPALAGHFPGNPIVPGVVILDRVAAALPAFVGGPIVVIGFPAIKFLAPLGPEHDFEIDFASKGEGQVSFEVTAAGGKIATGSISFRSAG